MLDADGAPARFESRMPGRAVLDVARVVAPHLALATAYLALLGCLGLGGPVHWLLAALFVASAAARPRVRSALYDALPFALFAAAYDLLRVARTFVVSQGVEVWRPYWFDLTVFGLGTGTHRITLNELFARHHWPAIDVLAGLAYFSYIYAVLGFAVYIALVDRSPTGARRTRALGWTFLGVNVAASLTYVCCPVAPPWYTASYGFGPVDPATPASPAALLRWDALVGVPYFQHFYAHASDIFGSMPSMHCAYPMILFLYALELRRARWSVGLALFQLLMCFSAIYLQHHYVSDVLVGMIYALLGYAIERLLSGRDPISAAPAPSAAPVPG
jgi:inositol phosphorylceramide synthase catalytic subunit